MMSELMQEQNPENQKQIGIGCMSGFLHIFDRQQILARKRIHSAKRLPSSNGWADSLPQSVKSTTVREIEKLKPAEPGEDGFPPHPASNLKFFPTSTPPRSPLPLPVFEVEGLMKSSWKFCKEMPRLSLDSRATVDTKGSLCPKQIRPQNGSNLDNGSLEKQQRSPGVIARLMGLEQLPSFDSPSSPETVMKPELRRSASESSVSRELFQSKQLKQTTRQSAETNLTNNQEHSSRKQKNQSTKTSRWRYPQQQKFDTADIFPVTTIESISDKNLKLRGVDQQSNDLNTLKRILKATQLKGVLHSINGDYQRNFVHDHSYLSDDSRVVLMNRRKFGRVNRYSGEISPRAERGVFDRNGRSPVRATTSPAIDRNANDKRRSLSNETQKRSHETFESRRNSPKRTPKRSGSEQHSVTNRSPRSKRQSQKIYSKPKFSRTGGSDDDTSSFSESSGSTTSQFDPERSKMEECREGKSLLARCDKLLAKMNSFTESQTSSNSVLPSPVSVLDSAFDKDESSSPSPVKKRNIDFEDPDDNIWTSIISPATSTEDEEFTSGDSDFTYISKILQASKHHPLNSSTFSVLEKQHFLNRNASSNSSKLQRKLVFDIITEILNRNRDFPPWDATLLTESSNSVRWICSEFQKIREPKTAENLLDLISNVLKKDLARNDGWGDDHSVEKSEAVLYIERLIFKDLVSETIRDLAAFGGKLTVFKPRRKLVF